MPIKTRDFAFKVKAVEDDGLFSGYASVFDEIDAYREIVKPGAFTNSIQEMAAKERLLPVLWQHDTHEPIGVYTELREDEFGLYVEGRLAMGVQRAREAHELLKAGAVSGISIGFNAVRDTMNNSTGIRELNELKLWEASIVTFPAADSARVHDVRAALDVGELPDKKTFERFLREAGFSKSQATAIAGRGLSYLLRSESGSDGDELASIIEAIKSTPLRGTEHV